MPRDNFDIGINPPRVACDLLPITPNDSTDLVEAGYGLGASGAGTISFISARGVTRSVTIGANGYIPVGVRRVRATGTTATGIYTLLP